MHPSKQQSRNSGNANPLDRPDHQKNIRAMAKAYAATKDVPDVVPELPAPPTGDWREGRQRMREVAAMYGETLARYAVRFAFGTETKSAHHRIQCMQLLYNMIEENSDPVPAPPENGLDQAAQN